MSYKPELESGAKLSRVEYLDLLLNENKNREVFVIKGRDLYRASVGIKAFIKKLNKISDYSYSYRYVDYLDEWRCYSYERYFEN